MPQNRNNSEFLTPFKQALIKSSLSARLLIIYTSLKLWRSILAVNIILRASGSGLGWDGGWVGVVSVRVLIILLMKVLLLSGSSSYVFSVQRSRGQVHRACLYYYYCYYYYYIPGSWPSMHGNTLTSCVL